MSILSTSPTSTRHFDMNIAAALGNINAAIIIQQLHYWMEKKEVGVVVEGIKYIYNSYRDWVRTQFSWLSQWQLRQAMNLLRSLEIVKVIRYKARRWNQTNYYTLDSDRLNDYLKSQSSESIEMVEMWSTSPQLERNQHLKVRDTNLSYIETKTTTREETAKQVVRDNQKSQFQPPAAAQTKIVLKEEESRKRLNHHSVKLS